MANIVPEKAINFAVYLDGGQDLLGVAEGALPNLEFMTSEVKGAGIAGTPVTEWLRVPVVELPEWCSVVEDEAKLLERKMKKRGN